MLLEGLQEPTDEFFHRHELPRYLLQEVPVAVDTVVALVRIHPAEQQARHFSTIGAMPSIMILSSADGERKADGPTDPNRQLTRNPSVIQLLDYMRNLARPCGAPARSLLPPSRLPEKLAMTPGPLGRGEP